MKYLGHERTRSCLFALLVLSTVPTTLPAADVTVGFVATIDVVDEGVCTCVDPDALLGLEIFGYYTFDNATLDSNPIEGRGTYAYSTNPYQIRVYVGDDVVGTDPNNVQFGISVWDAPAGYSHDLYWASSGGNLPDPFYYVPNTPSARVGVFLDGGDGVIASEALPPGPPNLGDWSSAYVGIYGPNYEYSIYATITWLGDGPPTGVRPPARVPAFLSLGPNPFSLETTFRYRVTNGGAVVLRVYDVAGRLVRAFEPRHAQAWQEYAIAWNARDDRGSIVPTGVYFAELATRDGTVTRKIVVVK